MGFFDFLKRHSEKDERIEVKSIKFSDLDGWIDFRLNELLSEANLELVEIRRKFEDEKEMIRTNLGKLEETEPKNKELPKRILQIMEGNRLTYAQKVKTFLEKSFLSDNMKSLSKSLDSFDESFNDFEKGVAKSHNVMLEFFPNEATVVSVGVKNLDKLRIEMKKIIEKPEIKNLRKLKKRSDDYEREKEKLRLISFEIEKLSYEEKNLKKAIIEENKNKAVVEKSDEHKGALKLIEKEISSKSELKSLESQMASSFSAIETALKKYENSSENKVAKKYLDNWSYALINDENLEIVGLLRSVKESIESGGIDLKEKKKERALAGLGEFTEDYFKSFLEKRTNLGMELDKLKLRIKDSVILGNIRKLEKEMQDKEDKIKECRDIIKKRTADLKGIDLENLKENFVWEFGEKFGDVKIV